MGEGGSKTDLIDCAKAIAKDSAYLLSEQEFTGVITKQHRMSVL